MGAPVAPPMRRELDRIREEYARREREICAGYYSRFCPFNLFSLQEREEAIVAMLREAGIVSLRALHILDVGCGYGAPLRQLIEYDAEPSQLFGVDLIEGRVRQAHRLAPNLQFACGNAGQLPFPDASFELALQFTLFTSVLNPDVKALIASDILRVLRPGGRLIWYDYTYDNPWNPNVRGIGRAEIRRLFPGCHFRMRRITLAPPLGRLVARFSPLLYHVLSVVRLLCTHVLCMVQKPAAGPHGSSERP